MGFLDDFSFDYNPYDEGDYSGGIGGGGGFSIPEEPQFSFPTPPTRTRANNYGAPGGNDLLSLYQRLGGRVSPDIEDYYDTKSPEWTRYQTLAQSRPESESIIGNYLSSMPTHEQYAPGFGRKAAGFLLGTLAGAKNPLAAGEATRKFIDSPYLNAFQDWKAQGSQVSTQARLSDAARGRELSSLKTNLDQLAREKRYGVLSQEAANRGAQGLAKGVTGVEGDAARLAEKSDWAKRIDEAKRASLEVQRARLELARENAKWAKDPDNPKFKGKGKTTSETGQFNLDQKKTLSNLRQQAAGLGIDFDYTTTPEELAGELARHQAMQNPAFHDLFIPGAGGIKLDPNADPRRTAAMKIYLSNILRQMLGGQ